MVTHPFSPVWNADSRILVLGSFPSVRSREVGFYYGHPQNRFWRVLAALYQTPVPEGTQARRDFVLARGIALWDVFQSCEITGSSDQSIHSAQPNDIAALIRQSGITRVVCNGKKAYEAYHLQCEAACGLPALCLPSTSAANAAWRLERLIEAWQVLLMPPSVHPLDSCGRISGTAAPLRSPK